MSQLCHTFMKMSTIILGYMSGNRSWTIASTQHWEATGEIHDTALGTAFLIRYGGCLTAEEAWNKRQVNKASTEKEMTCSHSLRTKRRKCSRKDEDQALPGKLSWWSEEWYTGRSFLGKRSPPWKAFRHASSFKVNCRYSFGEPLQKVWLAECTTLAYEPQR